MDFFQKEKEEEQNTTKREVLLSSAVRTPFTKIGIEVIVCNHLTSCPDPKQTPSERIGELMKNIKYN